LAWPPRHNGKLLTSVQNQRHAVDFIASQGGFVENLFRVSNPPGGFVQTHSKVAVQLTSLLSRRFLDVYAENLMILCLSLFPNGRTHMQTRRFGAARLDHGLTTVA